VAPPGRPCSIVVLLSLDERLELDRWQRSTVISAALVRRGRMVLLRARGHTISEIAREVGDQRVVVYKWLRRFVARRIPGLSDKTGRGRKPFFPSARGGPSCEACV
jgi:hypothetical protein